MKYFFEKQSSVFILMSLFLCLINITQQDQTSKMFESLKEKTLKISDADTSSSNDGAKPYTFVPKGWVNIRGMNRFCVHDSKKGKGLTQGLCGPEKEALWKFSSLGGKYIITAKSDRVINNKLGIKKNGNLVISMERHNGYNQKWLVEFLKDGAFMLKNFHSEKCMDNSASSKIGSKFIQWDCKMGNHNQIFYLIDPFFKPTEKTKLTVKQKIAMNSFKMPIGWINLLGKTGLCVTEMGQGKQLQQKKCNQKDNFYWKFKKIGTDLYSVTSRSGKVLTNKQSETKNGNALISWEDQKGKNQQWNVIPLANGKILLRNPEAAKCLDVDGEIKIGSNHIIYECGNEKESQMLAIKSEDGKVLNGKKSKKAKKCKLCSPEKVKKPKSIFPKIPKKFNKNGKKGKGKNSKKKDSKFGEKDCGCKNKKNPFESKKSKAKRRKIIASIFKPPKGFVNLISKGNLCVISATKGGIITQGKCGNYSDALWKITKISRNNYVIVSKSSFVLENKNGSKNSNNPIISNTKHNGPNQRWTFHNIKGNKFMIENVVTKKCVDISKEAKQGNGYVQNDCLTGNDGEHFGFQTPAGRKIKTKKVSKKEKAKKLKKKLMKKIKKNKKIQKKKAKKINKKNKKKVAKKVKKVKKILKKKIKKHANKPKKVKKIKKILKKIKKAKKKAQVKKVIKKNKKILKKTKKDKKIKKIKKKITVLKSKNKPKKAEKLKKTLKKIKEKKKAKKTKKKIIKKNIKKAKKVVKKHITELSSKGNQEKAKLLKKVLKKIKKASKKINKKALKKIKKETKKQGIHVEYIHDPSKTIKKPLVLPKDYIIINARGGNCVSNAKIPLKTTCGNKRELLWKIIHVGINEYKIQAENGTFLTNKGNVDKDGNQIISIKQIKEGRDPSNIWSFTLVGNGQYIIYNSRTKKCLDATNTLSKGSEFKLNTCRSGDFNGNQLFSFNHIKSEIMSKKKSLLEIVKLSKKWVQIKGANNLCLKAPGEGFLLEQSTCQNHDLYLWRIIPLGENEFYFQNKVGFKISLRNNAKNLKGIITNQYILDTEKFTIINLKGGRFQIKNNSESKCLDTEGKAKESGNYKMFKCNEKAEGQVFRFSNPTSIKLVKSWINIVGQNFLCLKNNGKGKKITQAPCTNSAEMLWRFEIVKGSIFIIVNKKDKTVIDLSKSKNFKGNSLVTLQRNNSISQRWMVQIFAKGMITIKSEGKGNCIDNAGKAKNNLPFRVWDCAKNNLGQNFRLEYALPSPPERIKVVWKTKSGKFIKSRFLGSKDKIGANGKIIFAKKKYLLKLGNLPKGTHIRSIHYKKSKSKRNTKSSIKGSKSSSSSSKTKKSKKFGGSKSNTKSKRSSSSSSKSKKSSSSKKKEVITSASIPKGTHIHAINYKKAPENRK